MTADSRRQALAEAALVSGVALLFVRWKLGQWGGFADFDGHYHLKVVQWIAHQGLCADIPWLPFAVLGQRGPDHHWLWHLALVPFTLIADPGAALAWAAAFNAAVTAGVVAFVLRSLGVPAAPLFALLAFTAGEAMPFRMMMLRAQNVAVIFMFLSFWAIARERWKTLALLAFLFLESYHAAVILLPMAAIGCVAYGFTKKEFVVTPLVAVAIGLTAALLVSPWYPRNIGYLIFHTLYKAAASQDSASVSSLVGSEWYPASFQQVLADSWPAHALLIAGLIVLAFRRRWPAPDTWTAYGIAILSMGLYLHAVRFAEYYIPFAVLAAALALRDAGPAASKPLVLAVAACLAAALPVGLAGSTPPKVLAPDHLERVASKLNELGQGGETVFNSAWPDFMALVWWADRFRYINGLDGHYLAYQDPARFAIWLTLAGGGVDQPAQVIEIVFGARFAVIARQHAALAAQLRASPGVLLREESPEGWLFEFPPAAEEKQIPPAR